METYELSNNFTNTTSVIPVQDDELLQTIFLAMQILSITCYSITFMLGIVGNGLVIWIAGFKMKKMVNTIWFLNLSIADFLLNIFLPFFITEWAIRFQWIFGQIMCKIIYTVLYLSMLLSTSFLMIIGVDRCISVLCPVWSQNHRTPRLAWNISKAIWLLCLIISSPYVVFYDTEESDFSGNLYCSEVYVPFINSTMFDYHTWMKRHRAMILTRFVTMFLIPFSIILVSYVLIALKVRKNRHFSRSARPFKVMISVVLCFFCCWFPFHMLRLSDIMEFVNINVYIYIVWYYFSYCLAIFNSCLNPILYVFIGHDFKKSLMKSIPFLMENLFSERSNQSYCNIAEHELETIHT
ncbi:chemerin-like receptor 1 [Discoglossus pictus]